MHTFMLQNTATVKTPIKSSDGSNGIANSNRPETKATKGSETNYKRKKLKTYFDWFSGVFLDKIIPN